MSPVSQEPASKLISHAFALTDFREGAALINNYGIINQSGRIEGGAKVETTVATQGGNNQGPRHPILRHKTAEKPASGGK